jgi:hypothetical protein
MTVKVKRSLRRLRHGADPVPEGHVKESLVRGREVNRREER